MATIDTRPSSVDILCYAGDTLTLSITSSADYTGYVWTGQIKLDASSAAIDAEFTFDHQADKTYAILSAIDTAALGSVALAMRKQPVPTRSAVAGTQAAGPTQYTGVWDIQVQSGDDVTTLVRGTIKVDTDVTRL